MIRLGYLRVPEGMSQHEQIQKIVIYTLRDFPRTSCRGIVFKADLHTIAELKSHIFKEQYTQQGKGKPLPSGYDDFDAPPSDVVLDVNAPPERPLLSAVRFKMPCKTNANRGGHGLRKNRSE